jgi:hypothetical protein
MVELFTDEANAMLLSRQHLEKFSAGAPFTSDDVSCISAHRFKADGRFARSSRSRDNKPVEFASPDDLPVKTWTEFFGSYVNISIIEGRDLTPVLYLRADMTRRAGEETIPREQKKPIYAIYNAVLRIGILLNPNTWYICRYRRYGGG